MCREKDLAGVGYRKKKREGEAGLRGREKGKRSGPADVSVPKGLGYFYFGYQVIY
jgi:hypothetical protein